MGKIKENIRLIENAIEIKRIEARGGKWYLSKGKSLWQKHCDEICAIGIIVMLSLFATVLCSEINLDLDPKTTFGLVALTGCCAALLGMTWSDF
jgi:hypothetical protein